MSDGETPRPEPPGDLRTRALPFVTLERGAVLHRFHKKVHSAIYYDPSTSGRLNAPDGSYGVLYAANSARGAFAEAFLRKPGRTLIGRDEIDARAYVQLANGEPLRLVKLYGSGLAQLGATAEVTHGPLPYDLPQKWSAALHAHPAVPDGNAYRARHDDDQVCYAIFSRAADTIQEVAWKRRLDEDWFYEFANHYNVGLRT